jgi:hypothetical protein
MGTAVRFLFRRVRPARHPVGGYSVRLISRTQGSGKGSVGGSDTLYGGDGDDQGVVDDTALVKDLWGEIEMLL